MELYEAMRHRHSVRSYTTKKIDGKMKEDLTNYIQQCNRDGGLNMQLVLDEPRAFSGFMAHYGKFTGVRNYIAVIGPKGPELEEKCGYYGEKIVLYAQQLGLNTCWVALTYSKIKGAFRVEAGEKLVLVIAIGYGAAHGAAHKSKSPESVSNVCAASPEWFKKGVAAALLAPTAVNQQNFNLSLNGNRVTAIAGRGFYTKIDLGIVKYHFEIGAGHDNFEWM